MFEVGKSYYVEETRFLGTSYESKENTYIKVYEISKSKEHIYIQYIENYTDKKAGWTTSKSFIILEELPDYK